MTTGKKSTLQERLSRHSNCAGISSESRIRSVLDEFLKLTLSDIFPSENSPAIHLTNHFYLDRLREDGINVDVLTISQWIKDLDMYITCSRNPTDRMETFARNTKAFFVKLEQSDHPVVQNLRNLNLQMFVKMIDPDYEKFILNDSINRMMFPESLKLPYGRSLPFDTEFEDYNYASIVISELDAPDITIKKLLTMNPCLPINPCRPAEYVASRITFWLLRYKVFWKLLIEYDQMNA